MNADSFDKFAARVKENCSFHLFAPMPEAYFYADPAALHAIGCTRQPVLVPDCDVEQFRTNDPEYLVAVPEEPAPSWAVDLGVRPFHPKRYLQFLLHPALYSETSEGLCLADPQLADRASAAPPDLVFAVPASRPCRRGWPRRVAVSWG
jgi:hypothetical protein